MKKITKCDADTCDTLRVDLEKTLKPFGESRGVVFDIGYMRYTDTHVKVSLTMQLPDRDRLEWERHAGSFGLPLEWRGQTFTRDGADYMIVGLDAGRRRFCVRTIRTSDNAVMSWTAAAVKSLMSQQQTKSREEDKAA